MLKQRESLVTKSAASVDADGAAAGSSSGAASGTQDAAFKASEADFMRSLGAARQQAPPLVAATPAALGSAATSAVANSWLPLLPSSSANGQEEGEEEFVDEEEINVMVQGVPKPLSEVTEQDQQRMSQEEFEAFHQALE